MADVFDALTSERPYKKAWSVEDAVKAIREGAGSHFDPSLLPHFLAVLPAMLEIKERYAETGAS
jgi:putative two-component system response regulator